MFAGADVRSEIPANKVVIRVNVFIEVCIALVLRFIFKCLIEMIENMSCMFSLSRDNTEKEFAQEQATLPVLRGC